MRSFLVALLPLAALLAQVDTGGVSGVVSDRTGAVIPGAKITIRQIDTNVSIALATNEAGFYSAPAVRPGRYEIAVAHEGFRPQQSQPFDLRVQDRLEVNFELEVGATSSEVTVTAAASLLESDTSSLGQVVEERAISDLPLNGRNFIQLAILGAGTLPSTRTAERDNFISNGARAVQNSYLLDGIDNKNRIMGFDKNSAQVIQPIIDAIQEFKVQTATFSAEFGQAAGGVVNVTLKSGTNNFHGNVFEFLRNSALDATPYFQPSGKPLFIQNQFGATLGGRIIKDRTFFFGSWQSTREVNAAPQIASVPTPAMRDGVFPGRVNDPASKQPFANNTIPQDRWDPASAKLLPLYPLPNLPGAVRNYYYNPKERVDNDQFNIRIDHRISSKALMFARISRHSGENRLPTTMPEPANQQGVTDITGRSILFSETQTISANKVNEVRIGQVFTRNNQDVLSERLFDQYGIKGALDTPRIKGLPQFSITGLSALGTAGPGSAPIPASGSGNWPSDKSGKVWQLDDNFSWVRNRHTIKFGVNLARVTMFVYATNSARPNFSFNGTYTSNPLGDFLLGYINNVGTSEQQIDTIEQRVYQGYALDDWKITRSLTLNIGLRYEMPTPFREEFDRQSNFVTDAGPCYLQVVTAAPDDRRRCGLPRGLIRTDRNNFAPRVGLAYQATGKTVVRSAFGIFYGRDEDIGIQRRLPNNPPFITSATFTGDQTNPAFLLKHGFPANALSFASGSTDVNAYPFDFPVPYVEQWNVNVQRDLGSNFVAQIGYTGSEAHKLPQVVNINQAVPGTGNVNARRPFRGFSNIQFYGPITNSTYNALLARLERRLTSGMTLLASYTYGHSIDGGGNQNDQSDPGFQDVRNQKAHKGSSNFDVRHRFVLSGIYQLPFGRSKRVLSPLVRNWQLSGIYSVQTGQPFTVTITPDPTATNTTARPNRIRDGSLLSDQRSPARWFDITAFVPTGCACFGNSGRNILRGPGFMNFDLGVARDFLFHERFRVQVRGEAFNLFNHPNFGLPTMAIGNPQAGIIGSVVNPERQIQVAMKFYF